MKLDRKWPLFILIMTADYWTDDSNYYNLYIFCSIMSIGSATATQLMAESHYISQRAVPFPLKGDMQQFFTELTKK